MLLYCVFFGSVIGAVILSAVLFYKIGYANGKASASPSGPKVSRY